MRVCVIGTGYVGLVAAACLSEMGNHVTCVDINEHTIAALNEGKLHIYEPGLEGLVKRNHSEGRLKFETSLSDGIKEALFVFNCVGTPSNEDGSCNLSFVQRVASDIGKNMQDYKIIVNKSTVPVGTADEVERIIRSELMKRNLEIEFDVVSNPEFLKEGDAVNDFMKPDRIIVGTNNIRTAKLLEELYAPFARSREKMIVMGVRSAEMTKYAANTMLATKISFINEIANICERVGADVKEVRAGIGADHRIGYHFIYPGLGYGGSCFPKDVRALIHTAKEYGVMPDLMISVDSVNQRQKKILADKILFCFEKEHAEAGERIVALWGLSFKANTDDIRESAALDIIKILTDSGIHIRAYDPVAGQNAERCFSGNKFFSIGREQYSVLESADALAIVTDWNQFRNPDFGKIKALLKKPIIFDGRNLYSAGLLKRLGFDYFSIGRPTKTLHSDN